MKSSLVLVTAVAIGCGSSSSGTDPDGGGGGGDGDAGAEGDGGQAGSRTVTLTLTNRPTNAAAFSFFVAYQDGSAAWQLAPAPSGDTYSFTIHAPSYGVAFACASNATAGSGAQRSVTSAHFAVGERTSVTLDVPARCSDRNTSTVTLSGNVSSRPQGGVLVVQFGTSFAFVGTQTGNYSLQVPTGTRDLVVSHAVPEGNGEFYVDQVAVLRDVAVTANTSKSINFQTAQSTELSAVDASDAPTNARVVANTLLYTANGTTASLVRRSQGWETNALAASQRRPTDVYDLSIAVSTFGAGATVTHATDAPGAQTYVPPAPLGAVMTTVPSKVPYITLQTTWSAYASTVGYLWSATQQRACSGNISCTIAWSAYLSPGVTGAMPTYRMPDLSALTGWSEAFELGSTSIVGSVTAMTSSAGASDFPAGIPAKGTDRVFVRSDFGITP